jgi:two-component system, response regulator
MKQLEILLVEDSPADTDLTIRELASFKLTNKITCFKDGVEALEFLLEKVKREGKVDSSVILLDLNLPLMNGIEFLHEIRSNDNTKDIPVAILTGTFEIPDIQESLRMGVRYISKPLKFVDMVRFVIEMGGTTMLAKG